MTTFVALLRAVNVGGRNRIPMADLRRALRGLGLAGVATYVQSGNVVFAAHGHDPAEQAVAIRELIAREFGGDVRVLVLTATQLAALAAANPFVAEGADEKCLHATFLDGTVSAVAFGGLAPPTRGEERAVLAGGDAALAGRAIYLYLPNGYGRTKLTNAYFERALGVGATTRNWRTVLALIEMNGSER